MPETVIGLKRYFLVDVKDSEDPAGEEWVQLAMQNGGSFVRSLNKVDTTHKQNAGFTSERGVTKTWSASIEGFDTADNIALRHLTQKWQSQVETDVEVHVMLFLETGEEIVGFATLDSFENSIGTNEAVPYSISLTGRGPVTSR